MSFQIKANNNTEDPAFQRFEDGAELIMSVQVDKFQLAEMFVFKQGNGVMVPFTHFVEALDFAILPESEGFSGWFINGSQLFQISLQQSEYVANVKESESLSSLFTFSSDISTW